MSQSTRESGVIADVLKGACGFALVSIGGFSVWAWFARSPNLAKKFGEAGLYAASAIVFILLSGLFLHPLVKGSNRIWRFYKAFVPAFLAYAVVWSAHCG